MAIENRRSAQAESAANADRFASDWDGQTWSRPGATVWHERRSDHSVENPIGRSAAGQAAHWRTSGGVIASDKFST